MSPTCPSFASEFTGVLQLLRNDRSARSDLIDDFKGDSDAQC
jgi:hypothetical protein